MKNLIIVVLTLLLTCQLSYANKVDSIVYSSFGKIIMYHPDSEPTSVALFVSGDGGWETGVVDMAKSIAAQGALVLGIDARHYKKSFGSQASKCLYPASDFENLSLMIQKKMQFSQYLKPVLVGYSYGATLIYGILAQAPANTFKGALALGFCPDIEMPKSLCEGTGLRSHLAPDKKTYWLERTLDLSAPFVALNGIKDLNCPYAATRTFLEGMPKAKLITLPKVGHGFSVTANWLPQFKAAYNEILAEPSFAEQKTIQNGLQNEQKVAAKKLGFLPLTLIPAARKSDKPLVFFISGDGGWTSFDQSLAESLAKDGLPVVGLDAQKYFWKEKSPEQTAADISRSVDYYMQGWDRSEFVIVGFSFGASVVPFVVNRFATETRKHLKGIILLSPDEYADFEIHIADMLSLGRANGPYHVLAELNKIKELKPVCIFGSQEESELFVKLKSQNIKALAIPGGHHYNNNFSALSAAVVGNIGK